MTKSLPTDLCWLTILDNWYSTTLRLKASNPETVAVSKDSAHIILVPKSEKKTADLRWFCNHCFTAATLRLFLFLSIFKLTIFPWMTTYWSWEKIAVDDIALIIYCWKIALLFSFLYFCLNLLFTIFFPMPELFLLNNFSLFIFSLFILAAPFLAFFSLLSLFLSVFSLSSSSLSSPFCGREKREITRRVRHWDHFFYSQRWNISHDFHFSRLLFGCVVVVKMILGV